MQPRTELIAKTLDKARANLANLNAERDAAFLGLLTKPDDPKLTATLDSLRVEIPQAQGRVFELESVLQTATASDSVEARSAERVRIRDLRNEAVGAARKRVALASKIDKAVADIGELLAEWADAGEPITEAARLMTQAAVPNNIDARMRYSGDLLRITSGTSENFRAALVGQLLMAGLFRTGIPAQDIQLEHLCSGTRATLAQVAELSADRMDRILGKFDQLADERYGAIQKGE